jgi:hypothetical protein
MSVVFWSVIAAMVCNGILLGLILIRVENLEKYCKELSDQSAPRQEIV